MSERLQQYDTYTLPVSEIYVDPDFNCRDYFTLESVAELAASIKSHGLQFPIIVQPWDKGDKRYRIVAGHRRFAAVTAHLKWEEIAASIRELDEFEARKLNLIENLDRKDLNLLEEARAVFKLYPNHSLAQIAETVGRTVWWVRVRQRLINMPDEVQQMAAASLVKAADIDMLYRLDSKVNKVDVAKDVAEQRKNNPKKRPRIKGGKYAKLEVETRSQDRIDQIIRQLLEAGITGLPPRVAAWCAGYITRDDLDVDIQEYLKNMKSA